MGGVLRALRHEMGLPVYFGVDDRDYGLLARREVTVLSRIFYGCLLCVAYTWNRLAVFGRGR